ncbi:MAG: peptide deformylase [Chloroflexi bacterium]|nr:peptide deformylase [Chloroflexota bacterium]
MAILPLSYHPDPVLRQKAKRLKEKDINDSLQKLIDDMIETMRAVHGVGLAAPQVGISLRLAVIEVPQTAAAGPLVLINPEIVSRSGEREVEEGCLSLPGFRGKLKRSVKVTVRARDRNGRDYKIRGEDLLAEALEHELDHLNGTLYIDHMEEGEKPFKIEPEEG